jgi:hypothetical protein
VGISTRLAVMGAAGVLTVAAAVGVWLARGGSPASDPGLRLRECEHLLWSTSLPSG